MATRDYSSVYTVKEFILNQVAPKYFDMADTNLLNIGLVGFATDVMATTTEDTFNSFSTYTKEIFPNLAQIPETLYNNAARFQLEGLMAVPSSMEAMLFINEADILTYAEKKTSHVEFVLDSNLIIDVEGQQFMMDYDVVIQAKAYRGDYIFSPMYKMDFDNSLTTNSNPYIRFIRTQIEGQKYIGLMLTVRRVNRFENSEFIINNDKVNLPTLSFEFNDQLANFEVFYKASGDDQYTQLKKRLLNSPPLREPFCFYKIKDTNRIEISFSVQETYFRPEFNSEIMFRVYTTTGKAGDFPLYKGDGITVLAQSNKYDYNNNIILFAGARTESSGGRDTLSLEELRSMIIELGSTSGAYTTENDLQLYFSNNKNIENNDVLFIKRRDDALERLFSAFSLFKDTNGDLFPTNTLNLKITEDEFDSKFDQSNRYLLKPGRLFKYGTNVLDQVELIPNASMTSDLSTIKEEFLYTNPYMITVSKTQGIVGYYLNSVDTKYQLDYPEMNSESFVQFICNSVDVKRDALLGENRYKFTLSLIPTTTEDLPIVDANGVPTGNLVLKAFIKDTGGSEITFVDFSFVSFDKALNIYTYEAYVETDDYMTENEKIRILNGRNVDNGDPEERLIPMVDCVVNFCVFYKSDATTKISHRYDHLPELAPYTMTNVYATNEKKVNFITPINMMRSQFKFVKTGDNSYYMSISFVPFVKAASMKNKKLYNEFINSLYTQYDHLQRVVSLMINNFGVDMKFYNTYGKSKNFTIGENGSLLNKVNCRFRFAIAPKIGVDETVIAGDIRRYIKNYVEVLNKVKGYNSIYISNLIQSILNNFSDSISHLKFLGINSYDSLIQTIENRGINIEEMTNEERRHYVPEYLSVSLDDIVIDIIGN